MINEPAPAKDSSEWYITLFKEIASRQIFLLNGKKGTLENTLVYGSLESLLHKVSQESKRQGLVEGIKKINRYIEAYHYDNYRITIYKEIQATLQALITDKKL